METNTHICDCGRGYGETKSPSSCKWSIARKGLLCYVAKLALVISNSRFLFNKVDYRGRNKRDLIGKKRFKRGIQQKMN